MALLKGYNSIKLTKENILKNTSKICIHIYCLLKYCATKNIIGLKTIFLISLVLNISLKNIMGPKINSFSHLYNKYPFLIIKK